MKEDVENLVMLNDELLEALFVYLENADQKNADIGREISDNLNASMRLIKNLE